MIPINTHGSKKVFSSGVKEKYTLLEKEELGDLCVQKKQKYDELASSQKGLGSQDGYISVAVREFYPDLAKMKYFDPVFQKAFKLAKKYDDTLAVEASFVRLVMGEKSVFPTYASHCSSGFWMPEHHVQKARLPRKLFKMKCEEIYKTQLSGQSEQVRQDHKENPMMFSQWAKDWMTEYRVSLSKPNKRYQIKSEDRVKEYQST